MAEKDYSTQDSPNSKPKKIKANKKETVVENSTKKLNEIDSPFDRNSIKKERDQEIRIFCEFLKQEGLSEEELIYFCASLKADLNIAKKRIKAFKEMNSVILEAGIETEDYLLEKNEDLLRQIRRKRSQ